MPKPITIHDIAREAGVSPSTVSRVLNGTVPVTPEKRDAVLSVINRRKYRPSAIAQGLARGRTGAVGVLTQSVASPFYGEILRGVEQGLLGSDYHALFASGNWRDDDEIEALDVLSGRRVDGLIVLAGRLPDERLRRVAAETPVVVVGRMLSGLERQCLWIDDQRGAYDATRYLLDLGHRRIVHVGGPQFHGDAGDRLAGYRRALSEAGVAPDPQLLVQGEYTEQSGLLAVQSLLGRATMFTAIFAANDQMAYGARLALFRHGIRVPDDVSLVGFDDQPGSAYTTPPLTTVRQPTFEMGRAAAQLLLGLLDGQPREQPAFGTTLVIRESAAMRR